MAVNNLNPAVVPPTAAEIATAVAAPSAATIAAAVAAPSASTIATSVAAAVPTLTQINNSVATNAPSPNAWTVISNITLNNSASSYTFSSLSGYKTYKVVYSGAHGNAQTALNLRFNGDSAANYVYGYFGYQSGQTNASNSHNDSKFSIGPECAEQPTFNSFEITIENCTLNSFKTLKGWFSGRITGSTAYVNTTGVWRNTSSITSITFYNTASYNFVDGRVILLGAN